MLAMLTEVEFTCSIECLIVCCVHFWWVCWWWRFTKYLLFNTLKPCSLCFGVSMPVQKRKRQSAVMKNCGKNDGRIVKWKCSTGTSEDGVVSQWISYFWRARDWRKCHAVCKWSNSFMIYQTHHENNVAFSGGEINAGCHLWGMFTIKSTKLSQRCTVWTYTLGDNVFAH